MRPTVALLALSLSAALLTAGARADTGDDALREKAVGWFKTNSRLEEQSLAKMAGVVTGFVRDGHNFTFLLGSDLTKRGKPFMLCGWAGEFFPFELTAGQARSLGMKPNHLSANANRRYGQRAAAPVAELSDLKIPGA